MRILKALIWLLVKKLYDGLGEFS